MYARISSVTLVHPAIAVGRNGLPFGRDTRVVPNNTVLDRGTGPCTEMVDLEFGTLICSDAAYCQIAMTLFTLPYLRGGWLYEQAPSADSAEAHRTGPMHNPDRPQGQWNLLEALANFKRRNQLILLNVSDERIYSVRQKKYPLKLFAIF